MRQIKVLLLGVCIALLAVSCVKKGDPNSAKPKGYFRIEIPEPQYKIFDSVIPFQFEKNELAKLKISKKEQDNMWIDIDYPLLNATFKMTSIKFHNNLRDLMYNEDKMLMFHVENRKADDIQYSVIEDSEAGLYGYIYDIEGIGAATPLRFWVTDSTSHFVRGSLYFNFVPNNDSLQPVIQYLRNDLLQMIETWKWNKK